MDPGPTISRPYTRHKWVGRIICSQAIISARAQDLLRLPESMTIIKNRTDNLRFSFPLLYYHDKIILFFDRINSIIPIIKAIMIEALRKLGNSGTTTYPVATPLRVKSGV